MRLSEGPVESLDALTEYRQICKRPRESRQAPEDPLDFCPLRENAKKKKGCGLNEAEWDLLNNTTAFDVLLQYVTHTYMSGNVRAR